MKISRKKFVILFTGLIIAVIGWVAAWHLVPKEAPLVVANELDKTDLIRLNSPRPGQVIESPLIITGEARGVWFFEASFPVVLVNWDGLIIAQGIAQAQDNWMTNDFVPFVATLVFPVDKSAYSNRGALILRKDNPSGLPEHDDALEIPVLLGKEEFNNINN